MRLLRSLIWHGLVLLLVMAPYYKFFLSNGFLPNPIMYYGGNFVRLSLLPIPYLPQGINVLVVYLLGAAEYVLFTLTANFSTVQKLSFVLAYVFYYFILNYAVFHNLYLAMQYYINWRS